MHPDIQPSSRRTILVAGPLPPPLHGLSFVTQGMIEALRDAHDLTVIDLSPHDARQTLGYHGHRLFSVLKGLSILLRRRKCDRRIFYIACDGGWGLIYNLLLAAAARLLAYPLVFHHHSFAYITRGSCLMRLLLGIAGAPATHLFLCARMRDNFNARYRQDVRSIILPNSAFVETGPRITAPRRILTIGLLSNLTRDKGLNDFLTLVKQAQTAGLPLRAVLAGPVDDARDLSLLDAVRHETGARLDYRGPVYGAAKEHFFTDIDVFVFPTRYANEAQPLVLFEALAQGIPVIACDRGCIREQIGACGRIVAPSQDFVSAALAQAQIWIKEPLLLEQLKLDARSRFVEQQTQARKVLAGLFA